jgi:hypothetical protein
MLGPDRWHPCLLHAASLYGNHAGRFYRDKGRLVPGALYKDLESPGSSVDFFLSFLIFTSSFPSSYLIFSLDSIILFDSLSDLVNAQIVCLGIT